MNETTEMRKRLRQIFEDAWEFELREDPLFATMVGDHRFNDRLPSVSRADFERREARCRSFLDRLHALDKSRLSGADEIDYEIFERKLDDELAEYRFKAFYLSVTNRSGFHVWFPEAMERMPLRNVRDYENYLARLRAFPTYVAQQIELLREGAALGFRQPRVVLRGFEQAVEAHIVDDPEKSRFFRPFLDFPEGIGAGERKRLAAAAREAVEEAIVPAYRAFFDFMAQEYVPSGREGISIAEIPDGGAFYAFQARHYTTLDTTPEEIHEIGRREVQRIRAEMEGVIERLGFEGGFHDFVEFLRTDPRFYVDTPEALLKEVSFVLKRMDGELPRLFRTLPRMPYGIKPVPEYTAPQATTAYYMAPAGDGSYAGFYYVNTYDLKSRPLYEIEALSLHEAVPGHHLQIALQQELEDLPPFRRFSHFTAFVEGWALYAERLGLEAGFYTDPYRNFGRLIYEMWRACRLVVDTGIHALGWSRQEAIDFFCEYTALARHNIETEIDRYIAWPGQALAYKMGELTIRRLREKAERELGGRFDLRAFHDVVLRGGGVPLDILEKNVEAYIEGCRSER